MFGHRDLVTCISITDINISLHVPHTRLADGIIVTGSRDATVCVWDWNGKLQRVTGIDGKHGSFLGLFVCRMSREIFEDHFVAIMN